MDTLGGLGLIVTVIIGIWGVYQTFVTNRLNRELHRLTIEMDQSIQRLYRARDATIERHKAAIYLSEFNRMRRELKDDAPQFPPDQVFQRFADFSAHWAELRGLAAAIGDSKLLELVNERFADLSVEENASISYAAMLTEIEYRGQSQRIHTRISELLQEATRNR
jgi:hypothetical protein